VDDDLDTDRRTPEERRLDEAHDQLLRYGGAPWEGVLDVLDALVEVNDDLHHMRDMTSGFAALRAAVDKLEKENPRRA
jgi:hypothetical protein